MHIFKVHISYIKAVNYLTNTSILFYICLGHWFNGLLQLEMVSWRSWMWRKPRTWWWPSPASRVSWEQEVSAQSTEQLVVMEKHQYLGSIFDCTLKFASHKKMYYGGSNSSSSCPLSNFSGVLLTFLIKRYIQSFCFVNKISVWESTQRILPLFTFYSQLFWNLVFNKGIYIQKEMVAWV